MNLPHYRLIASVGVAAVVAGLAAGCGSSGSNGSSAAGSSGAGTGNQAAVSKAVVSERQVSGVGTVLVDQSGKTLYSPQQEANGTIHCKGQCLSFWFPVTVSSASKASAVKGIAALGTIHRPDNGSLQLTYKGAPLYTFKLDQAAGQAHGNGFTDNFGGTTLHWEAATVKKAAGGSGGQNPAPSPSYSYSSGGSGY